ncbi:hypothetical protein HK099_000366 [Clydaea vesicula]|uniref:Uncharacterized protein n=1 Tax=Clydaea vesicula TaxID=447962 RepID=A0AAD5TUS4_9FUNG|nr:hypothetical protein HK099_000366 [Clydaea vesicula]
MCESDIPRLIGRTVISDNTNFNTSTSDSDTDSDFNKLLNIVERLESDDVYQTVKEFLNSRKMYTISDNQTIDKIEIKNEKEELDSFLLNTLFSDILNFENCKTKRLLQTINQGIVLSSMPYLYDNVLSKYNLMVKDVRGKDGWKIRIHFHYTISNEEIISKRKNQQNLKSVNVVHIRKEQSLIKSLDDTTPDFILEWEVSLTFDHTLKLEGVFLKILNVKILINNEYKTLPRCGKEDIENKSLDLNDSNKKKSETDFLRNVFFGGNQIFIEQNLNEDNGENNNDFSNIKKGFVKLFSQKKVEKNTSDLK